MNELETMLERNKAFASRQSAKGVLMPLPQALLNVWAIVIGCADMRVDPADILGMKPGEAVIMRNIGGRITPGLYFQTPEGELGKKAVKDPRAAVAVDVGLLRAIPALPARIRAAHAA